MEYCKKYLTSHMEALYTKREKRSLLVNDSLQIREYHDVLIVPGKGIFDNNRKFIDGTDLHEFKLHQYSEDYIPAVELDEAVFLGTFFYCWGHCLTDNIKRMWIFLSENYPRMSYLYNEWDDYKKPRSFESLLEYIVPTDIELKLADKVVRVKRCLLPDTSLVRNKGGLYYTIAYEQIITRIRDCVVLQNTDLYRKMKSSGLIADRIYLSRSNANSRIEIGNQEFDDLFKKMNYSIVCPEQISFEEQVMILMNCKKLIASEGSVSHNIVFCNPKAEITILKKAKYVNEYQLIIDSLLQKLPVYVDANLSLLTSPKEYYMGPFMLYKSRELCNWIEEIEGTGYSNYLRAPSLTRYLWRSANDSKKLYHYNEEYNDDLRAKYGIVSEMVKIYIRIIVGLAYFFRKTKDYILWHLKIKRKTNY